MFTWKDIYHWNYSEAGPSIPDKGPAVTGAKMFRGGSIKNNIRETGQNGGDASDKNIPGNPPVRMVYEYLLVDLEDLPNISRISSVIDMCYEYMKKKKNVKMDDINVLKEANDQFLKSGEKIPVLKISDYYTTGLIDENFESLMNCEGITYKGNSDSGGSFGFGKYAPYLLSSINTILYASRTNQGKFLFQGRSLLSTFEEDGKRKEGTSLFGYVDSNESMLCPITEPEDVPEMFRRSESGTDLYILCFNKSMDWLDQMVFSALENFFYAIYSEKLEFVFKDADRLVEINKENLPEVMAVYNTLYLEKYSNEADGFEFTAPTYWKVLTDSRALPPVELSDFRHKGQLLLYILMGDDISGRSVLEMRSSGMKIREMKNFERLPSFNGILIATGAGKENEDYHHNISKFLRELESPAHDSWELENLKKADIKNEAKIVLREIHKWIREIVKSKMPEEDGSAVDAFGLSKILPDITDAGDEKIEEEAALTFRPLPALQEENGKVVKQKTLKKKKNGRGKQKDPDPKPRPEPDPDREKKHRDNHQRDKVIARPVAVKSVSTPYIESEKKYIVSFKVEKDVKQLMLEVNICGDDASVFDVSVIEAYMDGKKLSISDGYIIIPSIQKGNRISCDVILSETEVCALEVKAYAKE